MSFDGFLRQSTAVDVLLGPFVDDTNGNDEETGLTIANTDIRLSANGQTAVAKNDVTSAAHDADGFYNCEFDTTDTATVGNLVVYVHVAGALAVRQSYQILEESIYDAMMAANANIFAGAAGSSLLSGISGTKNDFDDLNDPAINVTGGAVDTVTTLTNKTGFSLAATGLDAIGQAAIGMVEIAKAIWDRVITGGTHNITNSSGRRLRQLQEAGGYSMGAVYIDTINGSAGTTNFENGVETNPVDNIADANTVAASVGLSRFIIAPGSTITFAASQVNQEFLGSNWTLALGGQSIAGSHILGANITGIATGSDPDYDHCFFGSSTIDPCVMTDCRLSGTIIIGTAGNFTFVDCVAELVGGSAPILDYAAVGATTVNLRRYGGGITVNNLASGDIFGVEVTAGGPITLNGADATCAITGVIRNFTNNLTGSPNVLTNGILSQNDIADVVLDEALSGHSIAGSLGQAVTDIEIDTGTTIPALLPSALVGGRMDSDIGAKTGNVALSTQEKLDVNTQVDLAFTTQMADSVPADGTIASREQALYMAIQYLNERVYSGTAIQIKKVNGSTNLYTLLMDDATNPTQFSRDS